MRRTLLFLILSLGSAFVLLQDDTVEARALGIVIVACVLLFCLIAIFVALRKRKRKRLWSRGPGPVAVLDGPNIMHWRGGKADLAAVKDVLRALQANGVSAGVVFDANAGYKLRGRYAHHHVLARELGLPPDRVMVVNKGEVADGMILRVAEDLGARVVSNDRFRDWAEKFPQVRAPGFLISGRYRRDALQLDM